MKNNVQQLVLAAADVIAASGHWLGVLLVASDAVTADWMLIASLAPSCRPCSEGSIMAQLPLSGLFASADLLAYGLSWCWPSTRAASPRACSTGCGR